MRLPAVLIILAVLAVGCTGEPAGPLARSTPDASSPVAEGPCPNGRVAAADPGLRKPGSLSGDIDGDGSSDEAFLALDPDGPAGCRALLIVELDGRVVVAPAEEEGAPLSQSGPPVLNSLVQLDDGGLEIVVDLLAGASTQFVGLYTLTPSGLERIEAPKAPASAALFGYGGSVGHLDAIDCGPGGTVVIAGAVPQGNRYSVRRLFFRVDGTTLVRLDRLSERHLVKAAQLGRFHEFEASPLRSCPTGV